MTKLRQAPVSGAIVKLLSEPHCERRLLVGAENESGEIVVFQVGGLLEPGILEVRPDRRRMGYGRRVVEYCIEQARREDVSVLHIDCKPASSVPFWIRMGFRLYSDAFGGRCPCQVGNHAFRILDRIYDCHSSVGRPVAIDVTFRAGSDVVLNRTQVSGTLHDDGRIALPHRIVSYCPCSVFAFNDTFVDVNVNGNTCYSGKAKYAAAETIGVEKRGGEVFVIDSLTLPSSRLVSEGKRT